MTCRLQYQAISLPTFAGIGCGSNAQSCPWDQICPVAAIHERQLWSRQIPMLRFTEGVQRDRYRSGRRTRLRIAFPIPATASRLPLSRREVLEAARISHSSTRSSATIVRSDVCRPRARNLRTGRSALRFDARSAPYAGRWELPVISVEYWLRSGVFDSHRPLHYATALGRLEGERSPVAFGPTSSG